MKVFIDCSLSYYRIIAAELGEITDVVFADKEQKFSVDNIFVGRVEKILPSGIAFVDIGDKNPVFLQLTDGKERANTEKVKTGSQLVVRIEKEAYNQKRAVATTCISITGKYSVVILDNSGIGVSKKITSDNRRNELRELAKPYNTDGYSVVLRTSCENADNAEIAEELKANSAKLRAVRERGKYTRAPALLYAGASVIERTLMDLNVGDDDIIVVNDKEVFEKISIHQKNTEYYDNDEPMLRSYFLESKLEKLFSRKVWLKSGGYIIIDETEAMTVIDVNSGKAESKTSFIKTNNEAAEEIARQIRLRNLSGMIIVDFINTRGEHDTEEISNVLRKHISKDSTKTKIVGMTELGLMQITRQKKRKPLSSYVFTQCPYCHGTGKMTCECAQQDKLI